MAKAYKITEEISNEIRMFRKTIKNKSEDIRLHAVELRGLGKKNKEIAEILDVHEKVVNKWTSIFANQGIQGLMNKPKGGNHKNMTFEEEEKFLKQFEERAKKGELLSTNEIKQEYIKLVGHSIGHEQIYRVLRRHGYRKIMPRSRHPKKASNEDIVILVCDGAVWHKSKNLEISGNIIMTHIPPYTPEMNPICLICFQICSMGFGNKIFSTLNAVVDRLCDTVNLLTDELVKSITLREWIYSVV